MQKTLHISDPTHYAIQALARARRRPLNGMVDEILLGYAKAHWAEVHQAGISDGPGGSRRSRGTSEKKSRTIVRRRGSAVKANPSTRGRNSRSRRKADSASA